MRAVACTVEHTHTLQEQCSLPRTGLKLTETCIPRTLKTAIQPDCSKDPKKSSQEKTSSQAVASLEWVTPGAATEGVTPLFFPEKPSDHFLVANSAVSPLKVTTFFAHCHFLLISLRCHLPPGGYHQHLFYLSDLVSPLFFVNLPTKIFFPVGVTPSRVSLGAVSPPPLVTPLLASLVQGTKMSPKVRSHKHTHTQTHN